MERESTEQAPEDCDEYSGHLSGSSRMDEEQQRGQIKYDPVARWYYPAPYPSNQSHGAGA